MSKLSKKIKKADPSLHETTANVIKVPPRKARLSDDAAEKKRQYNRDYYQKNREAIIERNKRRFEKDPTLRIKRSKEARRVNRQASRAIEFMGSVEYGLTSGEVGAMVGKSVQTINLWEREGTIPPTPFRTQAGYRLWLPIQVQGILKALELFPRPGRGPGEFALIISEHWKAFGIYG